MLTRIMLAMFGLLSPFIWMNPVSAAEDLTAPPHYSTVGADARVSAREVTILRGSPRRSTVEAPASAPSKPQIVRAGVIGPGDNLWYVDSDQRIHACWLSGTGYVNSLKVTCTR